MLGLLVALMALGVDEQQNRKLTDILRDAQATNRALTRAGRSTLSVQLNISKLPHDIDGILEVETTWLDQNALEKRKFNSKTGDLFGRINETPLEKSPSDIYFFSEEEVGVYNYTTKIVEFMPEGDVRLNPLLEFRPDYLWYSCCPPNHRQGRSWDYMMGMVIRGEHGIQSEMQFVQDSKNPDLIRQMRKDPDGRTLMIEYSLLQGGNVVKVASNPGKNQGEKIDGSYQWQLKQGAYVLKSCDFEWMLSVKGQSQRPQIHVEVTDIQLGGVTKDFFTRESMLKLIPSSGIFVRDHRNKSYYKIPQLERVEESQLKELADLLQSRGFALPK